MDDPQNPSNSDQSTEVPTRNLIQRFVVDPINKQRKKYKEWRKKVNTRKQEKQEITDKKYAQYLFYDKYKLYAYLFKVRVKYLEPLKRWYTYNTGINTELENNTKDLIIYTINQFFEEEKNKFTDDEIIQLIINIENDAKIIKKRDRLE